mmetsp:Transcript_22086/g.30693  ORF Transcript_22086/g.30693 Transcript_22086/m.30693 type:complete len:212 (-) Transcript_22086:2338-2973(-)
MEFAVASAQLFSLSGLRTRSKNRMRLSSMWARSARVVGSWRSCFQKRGGRSKASTFFVRIMPPITAPRNLYMSRSSGEVQLGLGTHLSMLRPSARLLLGHSMKSGIAEECSSLLISMRLSRNNPPWSMPPSPSKDTCHSIEECCVVRIEWLASLSYSWRKTVCFVLHPAEARARFIETDGTVPWRAVRERARSWHCALVSGNRRSLVACRC